MKSNINILVVEDEQDQRELVVNILKASQFNTYAADSVEQAILMLKEHCIDVIFSDWKLGQLTGIDLLR